MLFLSKEIVAKNKIKNEAKGSNPSIGAKNKKGRGKKSLQKPAIEEIGDVKVHSYKVFKCKA